MDKNKTKKTNDPDQPITKGFFLDYMDDFARSIARAFTGMQEYMDKRFEQVDKRFEQVDKRFEQVDKRFEQVDKRFGLLSSEMHVEFHRVHEETVKLKTLIEFVNKSRIEDVDAFGDDILKHDRQIKIFAKRLTHLEKLFTKN